MSMGGFKQPDVSPCNWYLPNTCPTKCNTYATNGLPWSCYGVCVFALGWTRLAEACIAVPREIFYILGPAVWLTVLDTWLGSIANTSVIGYVVDARLNKASCESKWAFTDWTNMQRFALLHHKPLWYTVTLLLEETTVLQKLWLLSN